MIKGIDVSHYQTVDYSLLEKSSLGFCFIKATQGANGVDPKLDEHGTNVPKTHLLVGFYHYFVAAANPITQAQHFWDTINPYMDEYSLPPVLDLEDPNCMLSPLNLAESVSSFLTQLEHLSGHAPIIYTNKFFLKKNQPGINMSRYLLWDACYQNNPAVPYNGWDRATFWQYTDKTKESGMVLDGDLFMGTPEQLLALTVMGETKEGLNASEWVEKYDIKVL